MKLFNLFRIPKKQTQINVPVTLFSSEVSRVQCFETNCYFNRSYRSELTCDLKSVEIHKGGRCGNYKPRKEAAAFFSPEEPGKK
ncbi:hypothetical protein SDC9_193873 [bioreactor metagenome]|uniref:Uncharacterized protein n=1 Tax=bioreactor metagenome TaxID=1076179 RepID=A0A645I4V1_9ZZZZ